jgi:hypothetical protein
VPLALIQRLAVIGALTMAPGLAGVEGIEYLVKLGEVIVATPVGFVGDQHRVQLAIDGSR